MAEKRIAESPLQFLKGIGPKRSAALEAHGIATVEDLLFYFPRGYLDRSTIVPIVDLKKLAQTPEITSPVTVIGEVFRQEARRARRTNRMIFILTLKDESGYLSCVWFEGFHWFKDAFENGELLAASAVPTLDKLGRPQFVHPQFDRLKGVEEDEPDWGKMFNTGAIIPKYRSNAELTKVGLDSRGFRRVIRNALTSRSREIHETLSSEILQSSNLEPLASSLSSIHFPRDFSNLASASRRLKFDELFFLQLMMALRRRKLKEVEAGISFKTESSLARRLLDSLPFSLTNAQKRTLREIANDMQEAKPMNRLLQGDVGSGKTIVALLSALIAIDSGYQVALMAPTEVLAEQHFSTISILLKPLGINIQLLVGGQKRRLREDILEDIRRGSAQLVVGTHAIIESKVEFEAIGFVIIDEQHRFGVLQRGELKQKGSNPDVLVMSATPIPRTLAMTIYGDLDVSVIDELPANRKPIRTAVRTKSQVSKVHEFLKEELARGRQAYIVFPLVEESEKIDLKAAVNEFESLQKEFSDYALGLLHGRMRSEEKDETMQRFKSGALKILVATTVIEVGIDIPNATVMVIENAERFGLSQLHQLRGRVGRGADQSYCILISDTQYFGRSLKKLDAEAAAEEQIRASTRLQTMVETSDGFKIAEVDLQLRGAGELFGTRQSGMPELRIANLVDDFELVQLARREAFELIERDPQLQLPSSKPIRDRFEKKYRAILRLGDVS